MPGSVALRLRDLPPATGDAELAALLLLDLVTAFAVPPRHAAATSDAIVLDARAVSDHTVVTDGQLFRFADSIRIDPDRVRLAGATYSAAELALTRYLGRSPWPARTSATLSSGARSSRASSSGASSSALPRPTLPAYFGQLPDPFRSVFIRALSPRPLFRFTPAELAAALDHAFDIAGPGSLAEARHRLSRATTLGRAFIPAEPADPVRSASTTGSAARARTTAASSAAPVPADVVPTGATAPGRPSARRGRIRRIALVGAVFVVVAGGATAGVAAVRSGSPSGVLPPAPGRSPAPTIADESSRTPAPSVAVALSTGTASAGTASDSGPTAAPTTPTPTPSRGSSRRAPAAGTPTPTLTPSGPAPSSPTAASSVASTDQPTTSPRSSESVPVASPAPSESDPGVAPTFPVGLP